MIQALNINNIDPKASVKPKGTVEGKTASAIVEGADLESMLEGADFANELMASISGEAEVKVKPVEVSPEQVMEAPSKLIKMPEAGPDAISPQIFDPALTQGVDKIIQPKTTDVSQDQILKLVQANPEVKVNPEVQVQVQAPVAGVVAVEGNPEATVVEAELDAQITQAMLKTPQVQTGRSPAIDLAKGEIDPQLMNMEDFVSQKNNAVKKSLNNSSAYGIPNKAQGQKAAALESDLKSTQIINELGSKSSDGSLMNSQQFILSAQADLNSNAQVNETQAPVKVFNMSQVKTDNPNQIMTQITDYIVQAKAAKEPTVNMRVNHEELGMIDIRVQKSGVGQEAIAINIATHSADGKNFFQANSKDLFSHLTSTGLNITDLKVETPNQTAKSDFDFGSQSGRGGQHGADKQFGSEQNQRKHDSDRRQELWNLLSNKEAA